MDLSVKKRKAFELHYPNCLSCLKGLGEMLDSKVRTPKPFKAKRDLSGFVALAREAMDRHFYPGAKLLAASSKSERGEGAQRIGIAQGVAVDPVAIKGYVIDCVARVSTEETEKGSLEFNVDQVLSVKTGDKEHRVSPPFSFVQSKLMDLFRNNECLIPFRLYRRKTRVEIEHQKEPAFFYEAKSLTLAVIVAIVAAATGKTLDRSIVFSSRVRQDGALKPPVGNVGLKVRAALEAERRTIVLPVANREDCPEELLHAEGVSFLFFSHLGEVLQHFGLIAEAPAVVSAAPSASTCTTRDMLEPWRPLSGVASRQTVVDLAHEKGLSRKGILEVMEIVEDLSQMRAETKPISSAILVGDPRKIQRLLPLSEIRQARQMKLSEMSGDLKAMLTLMNGEVMAFVVDKKGRVDSVRKLNIRLGGDFRLSPLLSGSDRKHAAISLITDAIIFVLTPGGNRVHVYTDGQLICKYLNGEWQPCPVNEFEEVIRSIAGDKGYEAETVLRIAKAAIRMADLNLGALFTIFDPHFSIEGKYDDCLKSLGLELTARPVSELTDEELINMAKEDGATLIDGKGWLRNFMALLKPRAIEHLDFDPGIGSRHLNAQRFSADAECMTVVVSEDGGITAYCDGKKVFRL